MTPQLLTVILILVLVVFVLIGILLRRYVKRRVSDLDGACGVYKKKDVKGIPIGRIDDERKQNASGPVIKNFEEYDNTK